MNGKKYGTVIARVDICTYIIQQQVGNGRSVFRNRKEDTIISRIQIGHSSLNKSLLM